MENLTQQEIDNIKRSREIAEKLKKCNQELKELMDKYGTNIVVDPNSTIGKPSILIVMK